MLNTFKTKTKAKKKQGIQNQKSQDLFRGNMQQGTEGDSDSIKHQIMMEIGNNETKHN